MTQNISQLRLMVKRRKFMQQFITGAASSVLALSVSKDLFANPILQTATVNHADTIINSAKQSSLSLSLTNEFSLYATMISDLIATNSSALATAQAIQAWVRQSILYTARNSSADQSLTTLGIPRDLSDMVIAPFLAALRLIDINRSSSTPKVINFDTLKAAMSNPVHVLDNIEPDLYSRLYSRLNTAKTNNPALINKLELGTSAFPNVLQGVSGSISRQKELSDSFIKPVSFNPNPMYCGCEYTDPQGNVHQLDCAPCIGIVIVVVIIIIIAK